MDCNRFKRGDDKASYRRSRGLPKRFLFNGELMIVKVKLDDWAKKKLKSRMGFKMLGGGADSLSPNDLIIYSLISKEDGDTMDLTEEAGKLAKLLDRHS